MWRRHFTAAWEIMPVWLLRDTHRAILHRMYGIPGVPEIVSNAVITEVRRLHFANFRVADEWRIRLNRIFACNGYLSENDNKSKAIVLHLFEILSIFQISLLQVRILSGGYVLLCKITAAGFERQGPLMLYVGGQIRQPSTIFRSSKLGIPSLSSDSTLVFSPLSPQWGSM